MMNLFSYPFSGIRPQSAIFHLTHVFRDGLTIARYSTGAERLWYRVDWDRAVGNVVVVDPFDPGSLLYLPAPQYQDLLKTALANRTQLVVVLGQNDSIPTERPLDIDGHTYRGFFVGDVEVASARKLKNTPETPVSASGILKELREYSAHLYRSVSIDRARVWYELLPGSFRAIVPSLILRPNRKLMSHVNEQTFTASNMQFMWTDIRSDEDAVDNATLSRYYPASRRPLDAATPRGIEETIPQYRARVIGTMEATLLARFAWAGTTLLARSGRALEWAGTILIRFINIWQHNGLKTAGGTFAEARRIVYKHVAGCPEKISLGPLPMGIKNGLPLVLPRGMRRYILDGNIPALRLAIFLLSVCDLLVYTAPPKLSTIVDSYSGAINLTDPSFQREVRSAARALVARYGSLKTPTWRGLHLTTKAGPFGRALASAPMDAWALSVSPVYRDWVTLVNLTKGASILPRMVEWMFWLISQLAKSTNSFWVPLPIKRGRSTQSVIPPARQLGQLPNGKIATKMEPRGKVRVFAIPGYWIQSILRPLHDSLFELLKAFPRDNTFDQLAGVERIRTSKAQHIWSYDLSAATDRFPLEIQRWILEEFLPGHHLDRVAYASAWSRLLSGIEFSYDTQGPKGATLLLKYGVGQPMGAYSSWAVFTLSHHVMVELARRRALNVDFLGSTEEFLGYELLGDDISIYGDTPELAATAVAYRALMDSIGVAINPTKGVESANGTFEFAKRFVHQGVTLTCLKWRELASANTSTAFLALVQRFSSSVGHLPHLRCCLEIFYVLNRGIPIPRPLHHLGQKVFLRYVRGTLGLRNVLVLLTGPTGPYVSSFVDWLSGRAISLIDFHPNLGRYASQKTEMYCLHSRIANVVVRVVEQLAAEMMGRLISGVPLQQKVLASLMHLLISRRVDDHGLVTSEVALSYATNPEFTGIFRELTRRSPAFLTVSRAISDLIDFGVGQGFFTAESSAAANIRALHPDSIFQRGEIPKSWVNRPYDEWINAPVLDSDPQTEPQDATSVARRAYLESLTVATCRQEGRHPFDQLVEAGSLSAYLRGKISDILPSALPQFGSQDKILESFEARAVLRLYRTFSTQGESLRIPLRALGPTQTRGGLHLLSLFDDTRAVWDRGPQHALDHLSLSRVGAEDLRASLPEVFSVSHGENLRATLMADGQEYNPDSPNLATLDFARGKYLPAFEANAFHPRRGEVNKDIPLWMLISPYGSSHPHREGLREGPGASDGNPE
jgi:hypothetical protein